MLWGTGARVYSRLITALIVAGLATFASIHLFFKAGEPPTPLVAVMDLSAGCPNDNGPAEKAESVSAAPDPIIIEITLDRSEPVTRYLENAGLNQSDAHNWAERFRAAASTETMREGHSLVLYKDPETGDLRGLRYDLDNNVAVDESSLGQGVIRTSRELIQYNIRRVSVAFQVDQSFRTAAEENNLPETIVYTLESAFNRTYPLDELPSGSVVKLIYQEKVSRDGRFKLVTGVEAAQIAEGERVLSAFAFRDEHGRPRLFNSDGDELGSQLQALRFPLKFEYISSGFSFRRYHPILHEYRGHKGVDLVAKYGTPVEAISEGEVESAGWCGELGRCVRIGHSGGMVSIYGHLSEITPGVEPGAYVLTGQVIGRVGSSGLSTGPHLHFALEREGRYVDPMTQSIGVNHRVSPRMRSLFDDFKQNYLAMLARLPDLDGHFYVGKATASGKPSGASSESLAGMHDAEPSTAGRWHAIGTALSR
jgi:murein DD-endopeptidase MepM/ murein hydrolase activator NlpD